MAHDRLLCFGKQSLLDYLKNPTRVPFQLIVEPAFDTPRFLISKRDDRRASVGAEVDRPIDSDIALEELVQDVLPFSG